MTTKVTASVLANTTVSPGTYGGSSGGSTALIPTITVDPQGRLTSASNTSIAINVGASITDDTTSNTSLYIMLGVSNSGNYTKANTSSTQLYFNPSTGTLSSTIFNSLSDQSQKTSITVITGATNIIKQVEGVEFNWISNANKSAGVIAQQLEKILPHLVTDNDGTKSVNYSGLIAYLIQSVKELSDRIDELENK